MAATPITAYARYFNVGVSKVIWIVTIAAYATAVTRAEINAGTDLTRQVAAHEGWSVASNQIQTPDYDARFVSSIPGRIEAEDSTLTLYSAVTGVDSRSLMPRDATGFIVWMDGGDVPTRLMDVFPATVRAVAPMRSGSDEAARNQHQYSITNQPASNLVIPA